MHAHMYATMHSYMDILDIIQESSGWADYIYLNLQKAFNKVPQKRLMWKIKILKG